jgi:hypothetical protein
MRLLFCAGNEQREPKVPSLREEAVNEQREPKGPSVTSLLNMGAAQKKRGLLGGLFLSWMEAYAAAF